MHLPVRLKAVSFALLLIWPTACCFLLSAAASEPQYLKIVPGREWIHDVIISSPDGRIEKALGRSSVGEAVIRDGKTYYRNIIALEGGPNPFTMVKLVRKDESGFFTISESENASTEQMEVKLPLKVGLIWERPFGHLLLKEKVIGLETISIGEKSYKDCFHFRSESEDGSYIEEYWEAPHIGCVKSETTIKEGSRFTWLLREVKDPPHRP
jgi:hypothetical protein